MTRAVEPVHRRRPSTVAGQSRRRGAASPWTGRTVAVPMLLAVVGGVLYLAGYAVVAHEIYYDDQVPGINLAIAGVVLVNVAGVLLLVAGRRAVTVRRTALLGAVPAAVDSPPPAPGASSIELVGGADLTHFHRADCAMAVGRGWVPQPRGAHEGAGRRPCGVCRP